MENALGGDRLTFSQASRLDQAGRQPSLDLTVERPEACDAAFSDSVEAEVSALMNG